MLSLTTFSFALLSVIANALGLTCDQYCSALNPAGSSCSGSACKPGGQFCGKPKCSKTRSTTTKAPVAVPSTKAPVASTTVQSTPVATSSMDLFMWCEWPSGLTTVSAATQFYTGLLNFISSNSLSARIPKIVLRVLHPKFPALEGGVGDFYAATTTSLLYTAFISKLPAGTELAMYPYVMESLAGNAWMSETGASNPVEGAVAFMKRWNDVLIAAGSSVKFAGIVLDLEELPGLKTYSSFVVSAATVGALKAKYGNFEFGTSPGFDQTGLISSSASYVDKFYIQLYDFYTPTPNVDATPNSPFLLYKNQPQVMGDFVLNQVLSAATMSVYQKYAGQIMAMWSNQNLAGGCLYPLPSGQCGSVNEFGSWSAQNMNAFISYVKQKSPTMASLTHGLFQYSFTPSSWA